MVKSSAQAAGVRGSGPHLLRAAVAMATLVAIGLAGGSADARGRVLKGKGHVKMLPDKDKNVAMRYAALSPAECTAELGRRDIAFTPVEKAPGVSAPVRLAGPVGGVSYHTEAPEHARATSPFEVFDCRLVLALSDFSKVLVSHDIDEVTMFSAWRPPGKGWEEGHAGRRHPGGLAMDAKAFAKKAAPGKARVWLDVEKDFHGKLGAVPCGPGAQAPMPASPGARELRSVICEAADQHFFSSILTPNYDRAHRNHFHLEVTPDVEWYLVR